MKRSMLQLIVFSLLVIMFAASCASAYDSRKSRTCPSHDKMYFRR
ncbi:hypothetical protein [Panacibacter microcysteis]|nr:hypothetical protein [Panacibacter microcysteis]